MFLKTQLSWDLMIPSESLDCSSGKMLQKAVLVCLMAEVAERKASIESGIFVAVKDIHSIGEGKIRTHPGNFIFPVKFSCITFKMLPGEVLEGTVYKVIKHGVFLTCGPADKVYLSHRTMSEYEYFPGEPPFFKNLKSVKIEKGTVVRFVVLGHKFDEAEKEFRTVVSLDALEDYYLGPVPS
ncbi:DNA-directed RNA polymerase V subunit 7-like [Andrographis paniculata]|uniref:DNA-directed RNA polymerase V subunit 7-like n=1 Tax=Andrographis paniculata TaxID=175694 RepID=UPI0021E7B6CA|nr:DNA-directed RNA polymerase V subunit 7-like [Andrographis paniculata]